MPRLTITYKDRVVFDGDVKEFSWQETDTQITTKARTDATGGGLGGGLISLLEKAAAVNGKAKQPPPQIVSQPATVVADPDPPDPAPEVGGE